MLSPQAAARMDETSQLFIPESFMALYLPLGRFKPTLPRDELAARYEFCEDLAQMLVETCKAMQFRDHLSEDIVLDRVHQGLTGEEAPVSESEAQWVVRRTAELLASR